MRIGLIAMSGVRVHQPELAALGLTLPGFVRRGKVVASLPSLGLLTVAALTPKKHEVTYLDVPDFRAPQVWGGAGGRHAELPEFDLVGISSLSAQISEAYDLADAYRARGTRVVMGGLHVSALPDEALAHADAVVVDGAEGAWERVVSDAETGRLAGRYAGMRTRLFDPVRGVIPRFDLLSGRAYNRVTVQTSRGCPRNCEFCGAGLRITDGFQQKPVDVVMSEIREAVRHVRLPFLELADDNTFLNREWSRAFLRAMAHEEVRWFTETDVSIADDPELCDLLAESGCRQVLIGMESPEPDHLKGVDPVDWKCRSAAHYLRAVDELQSRGISVNGCFVLGLDHQTPECFPRLLEFVRKSGLAEVQYTVLTPFPGTPLRARLQREGRLLSEQDWDRCTLFDVTFRPARMSVEELENGLKWLMAESYSREETSRRLRAFKSGAG